METNLKFNSAICTSRSQSERLLALGLKKETADMGIVKSTNEIYIGYPTDYSFENGLHIPAWSLHRLKCLVPEKTPYGDGYLTVEIINENVYIVLVIEKVEQRVLKYTKDNLYDNLISCINFFINEGLLNKEYLEE